MDKGGGGGGGGIEVDWNGWKGLDWGEWKWLGVVGRGEGLE